MTLETARGAPGTHLYLDCFSGVAGDMFLGAMLDLGVPEAYIREHLARLPLSDYQLHVGRREHHSLSGCDVRVLVPHAADTSGHDHHHAHRHYGEIRRLIEQADLPAGAQRRALAIFDALARAEAKVHATEVSRVVFHEVGAVDSIVDIVGAALALDYLRPAKVTARPIPLGSGMTRGAHGVLPVPSPAAVALLQGAVVEEGGVAVELCTPTGAAIVAETVQGFGPLPAGRLVAVGYGAGDKSLADRPNHLRLVLLTEDDDREVNLVGQEESATLIEANIDDMSPELAGYLVDRLLAEGALDVWHVPIMMKKCRPATQVGVLCRPDQQAVLLAMLLRESTAIGVRYQSVGRRVLERRQVTVSTQFGPVEVKEAYDGQRLLNAAPEYDTCLAAARRADVPLKWVLAEAIAAYQAERPALADLAAAAARETRSDASES